MDELFGRLASISDSFLLGERRFIEDLTDQVLREITEEDLSDRDFLWWLLILQNLLGPIIAAMPLEARSAAIQSLYGVRPSPLFQEAVRDRMEGVLELEAARLSSRVRDARVGGALGEDFLVAFREALKRTIENVINETDTAMSMFDRLAFAEAGARQGSGRRWAYDGPQDNRNRPFCADVLRQAKTYSNAEVDALNSHPLLHRYVPPNVRTFCGGFGCRHIFVSLSRDEANRRGLSWD